MKNAKFRKAYYELSRENKQHIQVRNRIAFELNVSTQIVYNYINGVTSIKEHQKSIIANIFKMGVSELFEMEETIVNA